LNPQVARVDNRLSIAGAPPPARVSGARVVYPSEAPTYKLDVNTHSIEYVTKLLNTNTKYTRYAEMKKSQKEHMALFIRTPLMHLLVTWMGYACCSHQMYTSCTKIEASGQAPYFHFCQHKDWATL